MKSILRYIYEGPRTGMTRLTQEEYQSRLVRIDIKKAERAFDKAWATRNFEIELYWKRATYFWAFIASAFLGYFGLVNAASYRTPDHYQHVEVYFVICLGFVLSLAWLLTNVGSKQWQRHWEAHVDLLEDQFTGPLYKTVHPAVTFSVSKINEIVGVAITLVWLALGVKYHFDQDLVHLSGTVNWFVVTATASTLVLSFAMLFGHGRGRFGERTVTMHSRSVRFESRGDDDVEQATRVTGNTLPTHTSDTANQKGGAAASGSPASR